MLGNKLQFDTVQDRDLHYAVRWAGFAAAVPAVVKYVDEPSPRHEQDERAKILSDEIAGAAALVADALLEEYQKRNGWACPGGSGPKEAE